MAEACCLTGKTVDARKVDRSKDVFTSNQNHKNKDTVSINQTPRSCKCIAFAEPRIRPAYVYI